MDQHDGLAERFEEQRPRLRAVAYRMLGSLSDSEDAVQEAWLRLSRADAAVVSDLGAWLTTVVARVCLDMLRARRARREDYLESWMPEPIVSLDEHADPEQEALIADAVGLALLVVLETLTPAERLAFVLHDMFAVPFEEIAPIVDRTPAATRQLASRARRRVQGSSPDPDTDLAGQRAVVDAFLAASRAGDFEGLVAVLAPDAVLRVDAGLAGARAAGPVTGAAEVARRVLAQGRPRAHLARPAIVNGTAGLIVGAPGRPTVIVAFAISGGRISEIDLIADPAALARLAVGP